MQFSYIEEGHLVDVGTLSFRLYSLHELINLGRQFGLICEKVFSNMRGAPFNMKDQHFVIVFRKEAHD
ncbi:hypothetical protein CATRI_04540 [Corynebacterium atrinae]|nr:hypothetical protein CATRI_04540 [Corynebacterium atrinae]